MELQIWLKSALKLLNCTMGLGGIAVVVYGILMIRVWQPEEDSGSSTNHVIVPWFFHTLLGVGVASCAITFLGQLAANTSNSFCTSCYIVIVLLLLVLETMIITFVFLNPMWEKELPKGLTERLDEFEDFVESSGGIWKWAAWLILTVQGLCVVLASVIRTEPETNEINNHESDGEGLPLTGESNEQPLVGAAIV